jgi:hypothetical protein
MTCAFVPSEVILSILVSPADEMEFYRDYRFNIFHLIRFSKPYQDFVSMSIFLDGFKFPSDLVLPKSNVRQLSLTNPKNLRILKYFPLVEKLEILNYLETLSVSECKYFSCLKNLRALTFNLFGMESDSVWALLTSLPNCLAELRIGAAFLANSMVDLLCTFQKLEVLEWSELDSQVSSFGFRDQCRQNIMIDFHGLSLPLVMCSSTVLYAVEKSKLRGDSGNG